MCMPVMQCGSATRRARRGKTPQTHSPTLSSLCATEPPRERGGGAGAAGPAAPLAAAAGGPGSRPPAAPPLPRPPYPPPLAWKRAGSLRLLLRSQPRAPPARLPGEIAEHLPGSRGGHRTSVAVSAFKKNPTTFSKRFIFWGENEKGQFFSAARAVGVASAAAACLLAAHHRCWCEKGPKQRGEASVDASVCPDGLRRWRLPACLPGAGEVSEIFRVCFSLKSV